MTTPSKRILLTGVNGFIGGHIAVRLLDRGYKVRGTLRRGEDRDRLRAVIGRSVKDPLSVGLLEIVQAELLEQAGWEEALADCDHVVHCASPVPMKQPKNVDDVIRPALDGTLRVLRAAHQAGCRRVVLTSSTVAITEGHGRSRTLPFTEDDWTDLAARHLSPYTISKVMAERAESDFVRQNPDLELVVINPGFTIGPLIADHLSASMQAIERIVRNADPARPRFGYPLADVGDIAEMHVRALETSAAAGQRFIGASGFFWYTDIAAVVARNFPELHVHQRQLPSFLTRAIAPFKRRLATVIGNLDVPMPISTARAERVLGMGFADPEATIVTAVRHIVDHHSRREDRSLPVRPAIGNSQH